MPIETRPFDPAELLDDDETITYFLQEALEEGNPVEIARSVRTVIRARGGIEQVAASSGVNVSSMEQSLDALQSGDLSSLFAVLKALHLKINLGMTEPIAA